MQARDMKDDRMMDTPTLQSRRMFILDAHAARHARPLVSSACRRRASHVSCARARPKRMRRPPVEVDDALLATATRTGMATVRTQRRKHAAQHDADTRRRRHLPPARQRRLSRAATRLPLRDRCHGAVRRMFYDHKPPQAAGRIGTAHCRGAEGRHAAAGVELRAPQGGAGRRRVRRRRQLLRLFIEPRGRLWRRPHFCPADAPVGPSAEARPD